MYDEEESDDALKRFAWLGARVFLFIGGACAALYAFAGLRSLVNGSANTLTLKIKKHGNALETETLKKSIDTDAPGQLQRERKLDVHSDGKLPEDVQPGQGKGRT